MADTSQLPAGGTLNDAFALIYRIISIFAAFGVGFIAILGAFDIFTFTRDEVSQKVKFVIDPNLFNKDTIDVRAMNYLNNDIDNEPYNIFLQQKLSSGIFTLTGIALIIFGIQLGTFFALKLTSVIKRMEFTEKISLPMRNLVTIIVAFIGVYVLEYVYRNKFIKEVQPTLKNVRTQLRDLRKFIYANMDYDRVENKFFKALTSNDIDGVVDTLRATLAKSNQTARGLQAEDYTAARMLFTVNLYTYFNYEIPEGEPAYEELRGMFSREGFQRQTVDPTMYFYYKRPIYVPNIYPIIRERLRDVLGRRERMFLAEVSRMMRELNRRLSRLQTISDGKKNVNSYIKRSFALLAVFLAIILGLFYEEARPYFVGIWTTVSWTILKLKSFFFK